MKKQIVYFFLLCLTVSVAISSCNSEEMPPLKNREAITFLSYTLTPTTGGPPVIIRFEGIRPERPGGQIISKSGSLEANTTYNAVMGLKRLKHTSIIPNAEDVLRDDIRFELGDYQFFFQTTVDGMNIAYNMLDVDVNGDPIGIDTEVITTDAGQGELTITLRNQPNKDGEGVSDGDITNAGGETEVEVKVDISVI